MLCPTQPAPFTLPGGEQQATACPKAVEGSTATRPKPRSVFHIESIRRRSKGASSLLATGLWIPLVPQWRVGGPAAKAWEEAQRSVPAGPLNLAPSPPALGSQGAPWALGVRRDAGCMQCTPPHSDSVLGARKVPQARPCQVRTLVPRAGDGKQPDSAPQTQRDIYQPKGPC